MISGPPKNPAISIIIPTLEEEKEIVSSLSQFTPELRKKFGLEIIVSDGGSKDRTCEIAREHADIVISPEQPEVQTIATGRNRGAKAARGEVLMFFNADVRLNRPETFIQTMLDVLATGSVAAATCNVLVNPEEETTADRIFHAGFNRYCRFLNFAGMGMGRGECHVVPRAVFDRAGGYNEQIVAGEDYELFLRLRRQGSIAFVSSLTVFESPRRFRAFGYTRIALLWFLNGVSVFLFRRSLSKSWIPIR